MITLFLTNLLYRWREYRDKPRIDYVDLKLVNAND